MIEKSGLGQGILLGSHIKSPTCKSTLQPVDPEGVGGRPGESNRGRWEGPSRTRGVGEEQRVFAPPTWAQEACWAPRWGPPPCETRGTRNSWAPSVPVEPKPNPPPPPHQGLFQPCGS